MTEFLSGTGFLLALGVFFLGMLHRCVWYVRGLNWRLDHVGYRPHLARGVAGGLYSVARWLVPFASVGWRSDPLLAAASFLFHVSVILSPLFLHAHAHLFYLQLGVQLPVFPGYLSRIFTVCAILGLLALMARRIFIPRVRALTTKRDWFLLVLLLLPLASGLAAALTGASGAAANGAYRAHLITGALFLVAAPFTKFSHCLLFFFTRMQIGMDFAIKRGGKRRGPFFPW